MHKDFLELIPKMRMLGNRQLKPELIYENINDYKYLLSQSQLTKFKQCPLDWTYRYMVKMPVSDIVYAGTIAGEAWHVMLEEYMTRNQKISKKELWDIYVKAFYKIYTKYKNEGARLLYSFLDYVKKTENDCIALITFITNKPAIDGKYKKFMTEVPILFQYSDDIWVRGYIDLVAYKTDKTVDLWDWKTTSNWKPRTPETDLQMQIFVLGFEKLTGLKVKNFGYWVFQKKPEISFFPEINPVDSGQLQYYLDEFMDNFVLKTSTFDLKPTDLNGQKSECCTFCKFKGATCKEYESNLAKYKQTLMVEKYQ